MHLPIPSRPLATAAICSALTFALPSCRPAPEIPKTPETIEELAQALGPNYRPLQARLTGGFGYAPCKQAGPAKAGTSKPVSVNSTKGNPWYSPEEGLVPNVRCSTGDSLTQAQRDRLRLARSRHLPKPDEDPAIIYRGPGDLPAPGPSRLHLAAITELAHGEDADLDLVVDLLGSALDTDPEDPKLLADLSAVYLLRGQEHDRPRDLARALSVADRAVEIDPNFPEAVFNRALALDSWFLKEFAKSAWERYLELDKESDWAEEAQRRLATLEAPAAAQRWGRLTEELLIAAENENLGIIQQIQQEFPSGVRETAEDAISKGWASAYLARDSENAERWLAIASSLGMSLQPKKGNHQVLDDVELILSSNTSDLRRLARAHSTIGARSRAACREALDLEANYAQAADLFREMSSPSACVAQLEVCTCKYFSGAHEAALECLAPIFSNHQSQPLVCNAAGRMLQALTFLHQGDISSALEGYRRAALAYQELGEPDNESLIERQLAESLGRLGEQSSRWHHIYSSISRRAQFRTPHRDAIVLAALARAAEAESGLAIYLHTQAIDSAVKADFKQASLIGLVHRALNLTALGRVEAARADTERAKRILEDSPFNQLSTELYQGHVRLVQGLLLLQQNPDEALESLDAAVGIYRKQRRESLSLPALVVRARALIAQEQTTEATRAIREIGTIASNQVSSIDDAWMQSLFINQLEELRQDHLEHLIDSDLTWELVLDEINWWQSLNLTIWVGRASNYSQGIRHRPFHEDSLQTQLDLSRLLRPHDAFVSYTVLRKRTLLVIRTSKRQLVEEVDIAEIDLRKLLSEFTSAIKSALPGTRPRVESAPIFTRFVQPILNIEASLSRLIVSPDGAIHDLPLAALVNPNTDRYLVEDIELLYTPSAAFFASSAHRNADQEHRPKPEPVMVSASSLATLMFPKLVPLRNAHPEVQEVATAYLSKGFYPRVLSESDDEHFLSLLGSATVIHFAGHAISTPEAPASSALVTGSGSPASLSGLTYAHEILTRDSRTTELVVLSACDSLAGPHSLSHGPFSLGLTLLMSGVENVIGSTWRIEDRISPTFMAKLHSELAQGAGAPTALAQAQRFALNQSIPIQYWASFRSIGSNPSIYKNNRSRQ